MSSKLRFSAIVLAIAAPFLYAKPQAEFDYKPGEVIIRFKSAASKTRTMRDKQSLVERKTGGRIHKSYRRLPDLHVIELPKNMTVPDAIAAYSDTPDVLYVEPNYKLYLHATYPDDPYFVSEWGLHNTGQEHPIEGGGSDHGTQDADIDGPQAWQVHTGGPSMIVAVLDSGIDYDHPDLTANMWINEDELTGDPNHDDDGNGYKDDVYGFDFADCDSDPNDYYLHGTHVAGTIGAVGNNDLGVTGVCWNVRIMSVKIFPNYQETTFISRAIEGIEYAVNNGARVLNNSWAGGAYSQALKDAIDDAGTAGVLFVASAGNWYPGAGWSPNNDYEPTYPASYSSGNILSVLATDHFDARVSTWSWQSHYGATSVDIGAPGGDIFSTFPRYMTPAMTYWGFSTHYETISGTSMAAPHVSGACALVWSKYPHLKMPEVKEAVLAGADRLPSLEGLCLTGGRLNLYQALVHAYPIDMAIEDNVADPSGCVEPGNEVTFTITYGNPSATDPQDPNYFGPAEDAEIRFTLPDALDYANITDPNYSLFERTFVWDIGLLNPGDTGSETVTLTVNQHAAPASEIVSKVTTTSSLGHGEAYETTRVCCWGGDVIYVDMFATGTATGTSWADAYTDLQSALSRAAAGCGTEIWIAQGRYSPGPEESDTFAIPAGVPVYGGFRGDETSRNERDWQSYSTVLSGLLQNQTAVTMGQGAAFDGLVIEGATAYGVKGANVWFTITHCTVRTNGSHGIYADNATLKLWWSDIADNGGCGLYQTGVDRAVEVFNCRVHNNAHDGVSTAAPAVEIRDSVISGNGLDGDYYGLNIGIPLTTGTIHNNTIAHNNKEGLHCDGQTIPDVRNCILWGNNGGGSQLAGLAPDEVYYCCISDCNDINSEHNTNDDPCFAYTYPQYGYYHLAPASPCIDTGDPTYVDPNATGEYDIDGEDRIINDDVDMGADEVTCEDVYNALDLNADGAVSFGDFALLAGAWLTIDPNHPDAQTYPEKVVNWNTIADLDQDLDVDLDDLALLTEPWAWNACWRGSWHDVWMMGASATLQSETPPIAELPQPTVEEQYAQATEIIEWLEALWANDPEARRAIDKKLREEFMAQIYTWLAESGDELYQLD